MIQLLGKQATAGAGAVVVAMLTSLVLGGCAVEPVQPQRKVEFPVFPPPPEAPRFYYERTIYSSADVKSGEMSSLQRVVTGAPVTGEGLEKPYGIAAHQGRIYVSDTVRRAVAVFDIPARKFTWLGEDGDGALRLPIGVDTDAQGNVYVADASARRVVVFDPAGKYVRELGGPEMLTRPTGIGVNAEGTRVYVADTGGVKSEDHRVRTFELPSGKHLFDIGKRGSAPGEFNLPNDVVVAADGSVYVVDSANFRVQVFDRDGKFVRFFGSLGRRTGQFARPKEAALDRDGNVYIVDAAFGNFQIFNSEGQLLLDIGTRGASEGPARYMLPSGIAVDGDGRVYVVDQFFRKVDVYRPASLPTDQGYAGSLAATRK